MRAALVVVLVLLAGCSAILGIDDPVVGDDVGDDGGVCDPAANTGCEDGLVCENVSGGGSACFTPVLIRGSVFDLDTRAALAGVRVVALDPGGAAVSVAAVSETGGRYDVQIPTTRSADGTPAGAIQVRLRAEANGYFPYPGLLRLPVALDTSTAVEASDGWIVQSARTDLGMVVWSAGTGGGAGTITGHLDVPRGSAAIVVAQNWTVGRGIDAVVDRDGYFVIFNLRDGSYDVEAYAQGFVHQSVAAEIASGGTADVDLAQLAQDAVAVSGTVQIVNAPVGSTSVTLAVESTYSPGLMRGAALPGLVAEGISGGFTIDGVPPGRYIVLAALGNDDIVRDPDLCVSGNEPVIAAVGNTAVTLEPLRATGALAMISPTPGAEVASGVPIFSWTDGSAEDQYRIQVFDSLGIEAWATDIGGVSGGTPQVTGPALPTGPYQVRVTSLRLNCAIATTEDLEAVFLIP